MGLPEPVQEWHDNGAHWRDGDHDIFVIDQGAGDAILILHGFPSSTHDWVDVVGPLAAEHRVLAFDMLGYGLSDKPPEGPFDLMAEADRAERLLAERGVDRVMLVTHDMGQTVGAELMARHEEGRLAVELTGVVVTNGSTFIDLAQLSPIQQALLAMPDEMLPEPLDPAGLTAALPATFSPAFPPSAETVEAMVALLQREGGDRLLPKLIRYIEQRRANLDRWSSGLMDFTGPMKVIWGELDPIAVVAMADRLRERAHPTMVEVWSDVAHWPSIEVPQRMADAILDW